MTETRQGEVYTEDPGAATANRAGPASFRRQIEAVKDAVRIEDVAADRGEFRLMGAGRLLGRCVSPDHEDKTPSMTIFQDEQRFKCFGIGCGAHGDVIDLVALAEGCELWEAMMILSQQYGVELTGRPASWYARQKRQGKVRAKLEEAKVNHVQRRLFRLFRPHLERIDNPLERQAEKAAVWNDLGEIAVLVVERGRGA